MNCQQTGVHTIKAGDSLFKIAQMHQMTVPELFELNPGVDPYNLQIGAQIVICRDNELAHEHNMNPETPVPAMQDGTAKQLPSEDRPPAASTQPGDEMNGGFPSMTDGGVPGESNTMMPPISGGMAPSMPSQTVPNMVTGENRAVCLDVSGLLPLNNQMRQVWAQHVYWFTMLLNSIAANAKDQTVVSARVMRNPDDIAAVFAGYYPADMVSTLRDLLRDHLRIGESVITVWNNGDRNQANRLNEAWFRNAGQIAEALGRMNPYYRTDQLRTMMSRHLQMTARQAAERLAGNYEADIAAFGQVENDAMDMADYLTSGLARQFTNTIR